MKRVPRILAQSGILLAVSAAVLGTTVAQAASSPTSFPKASPSAGGALRLESSGAGFDLTVNAPTQDNPEAGLEARIKAAIEEVQQQGQAALEELGNIDSPEKADRASAIVSRMEGAVRDLRKELHSRMDERLDEVGDMALARIYRQSQQAVEELAELDTPEKEDQVRQIEAQLSEQKAKLAEHLASQLEAQNRLNEARTLPRFNLRRAVSPEPPASARALIVSAEPVTEEQVEQAIAQLRQHAQQALAHLGELDTPGKQKAADKIKVRTLEAIRRLKLRQAADAQVQTEGQPQDIKLRVEQTLKGLEALGVPQLKASEEKALKKLEDATTQIREKVTTKLAEQAATDYEKAVTELQTKAKADIEAVGTLDTQEKVDEAKAIRAKYDEDVKKLKQLLQLRVKQGADLAVEQNIKELRKTADATLRELNTLNTPDKVVLAQRLMQRLTKLADHRFKQELEQETQRIRSDAKGALQRLGLLDTPEKVERARQIRADMEQAIQQARRDIAARLEEEFKGQLKSDIKGVGVRRGRVFTGEVKAPGILTREERLALAEEASKVAKEVEAQPDARADAAIKVRREAQASEAGAADNAAPDAKAEARENKNAAN